MKFCGKSGDFRMAEKIIRDSNDKCPKCGSGKICIDSLPAQNNLNEIAYSGKCFACEQKFEEIFTYQYDHSIYQTPKRFTKIIVGRVIQKFEDNKDGLAVCVHQHFLVTEASTFKTNEDKPIKTVPKHQYEHFHMVDPKQSKVKPSRASSVHCEEEDKETNYYIRVYGSGGELIDIDGVTEHPILSTSKDRLIYQIEQIVKEAKIRAGRKPDTNNYVWIDCKILDNRVFDGSLVSYKEVAGEKTIRVKHSLCSPNPNSVGQTFPIDARLRVKLMSELGTQSLVQFDSLRDNAANAKRLGTVWSSIVHKHYR